MRIARMTHSLAEQTLTPQPAEKAAVTVELRYRELAERIQKNG
jgi:hypothetical protein